MIVAHSTRLLLASDLHGSNACFQKLVDLALELSVDFIAAAGDWSGKSAVIYRRTKAGGLQATLGGKDLTYDDYREPLNEWKNRGLYPLDETLISDNSNVQTLLAQARVRRLQQWLNYGQEFCDIRGIKLFSIPGNDDGKEMVEVLRNHPWVRDVDDRVQMMGEHEVFGLGYSNSTPWNTERELSEEQIFEKLEKIARNVGSLPSSIAMVHVPPFGTNLDLAPELKREESGRVRMTGNGDVSVGSTAVLKFIEEFSPLLVLSGHCHSSRNFTRIGATACFNAGSQYHAGVLSACVLSFSSDSLLDYQFVVR